MRQFMLLSVLFALAVVAGCKPARSAGVTVAVSEATKPAPAITAKVEPEPKPAEAVAAAPAFAGDLGTKVLARELAPRMPKLDAERRSKPLERRASAALERPELIAGLAPVAPPRLALPKRSDLKPRLLAELVPLGDFTAQPEAPQRPEFPAPKLVRTPSRDVNLPIDLPVQARYQPDRASLEDPTAEYSVESARAAVIPPREKPAPFVRFDLPEPFGAKVEVRTPEAEPPVVAPAPQPPK